MEQEGTTMALDANSILFGSNSPAMGFDPGVKIRARITEQSGVQRKEVKWDPKTSTFEQGLPLYWKDGKTGTEKTDRPVMDPVLTVQSLFTAWEGVSAQASKIGKDDGMRRVFVKGRSKATPDSIMDAVIAACKDAQVRKIEVGDFIEIECTGEGKKASKAMSPPKLYAAQYWTAANPPEWASQLPSGDVGTDESDEDNPFDV